MENAGENGTEIRSRFQDLCADLNMDKNASDEAWNSFQRISANYTLEGDSLHWLACALYAACRSGVYQTVGRMTSVEGNCVSLTRLLRSCKLSLVQFFNKMKKWADMANLPQDTRKKVDHLERNFNVSTVIFKKYEPIFLDIFKDPSQDPQRPVRSRKQRKPPCSISDVFSFCWTLFVHVKGNFPSISDDLVNSYHLLLCCIDLFYGNALLADRRDLLNDKFAGLPENFHNKDYKSPADPPCTIQFLCTKHQGIVVEAKGIKEHWWKPYIRKLIKNEELKGREETLTGLLDLPNFESNSKAINRAYEEYVLKVGDFDERVFLGENANEEIGTPAKKPYFSNAEFEEKLLPRNLKQHLEQTNSLAPPTPLTSRVYLMDKEAANVTPVSTATQSVSRLQSLLNGYKTSPSDTLLELFKECARNPIDDISARVKKMGEMFCTRYVQPWEDHPGSQLDFAKKRLQLGETLYYKVLENVMTNEKKRLPPKTDLSSLLEKDEFHKTLFACCLEIVLFSYNSQRTFPWILEVFDFCSYDFYKVIEPVIRAEEGLSRDVVKHLNHVEEQILESKAWSSESPLWEALKLSRLPVPSCEEVSLPNQSHPIQFGNTVLQPILSSPQTNNVVRRLVGTRELHGSPANPTLADRFQSPITGSGSPSTPRRRLFGVVQNNQSSPVGPIIVPVRQSTDGVVTQSSQSSTQSQGQTIAITIQNVQSNNGLACLIPTQVTNSSQSEILIPNGPSNLPSVAHTTGDNCTADSETTVTATETVTTSDRKPNKPRQTGSLGLFFRKVYHLAGVRLRDLCDRLHISDDDLRRKIWTCFEHALMHHTDLMRDRHLDQLMMCSVYVICRATKEDKSFQEIMKCYRLQPQAASHVYRSVLLSSKKRRNSGSSENSENSGSNSPIPGEEEKDKDSKRTERLSTIRSSSTLPVPHPSSQPPTPTRLAGTGAHFEFDEWGDLIQFYNKVFVPKLQKFARKFSQSINGVESPTLSPLPRLNANPMSPWRRVCNKHSVFISPLKNASFPPSPHRPMTYSFNRSPSEDLRAINNMVRMGEKKVGKRILQDDTEMECPTKRDCSNLRMQKIQNVITERQGPAGGTTE